MGLGVVPELAVLPHFDRFEHWVPDLVDRRLEDPPAAVTLVGIDEETALVCSGGTYRVAGRQCAWRIERDGTRTAFEPGSALER